MKIKVKNTANNAIVVNLPTYHFRARWDNKGSIVQVEEDILEAMMYDTGCRYYLENGILYIDDMEIKKKLGLEPDDATTPQNIVLLTEEQIVRFMTVMPLNEFKNKIKRLSQAQCRTLVDYVINSEVALDFDKTEVIKERTGIDVIERRKHKRENTDD